VFGFGRKAPATPEEQLRRGSWTCGKCSVEHGWPFDLAASVPDPWPRGEEYEHNGALRMDGDFLSEDFCVLDGQYFMIRCVLTIPVVGLPDNFGFGCWSTLSRENFEKYIDDFDRGSDAETELWGGWLCNRLETFNQGDDPLAVWVQRRPNRQRPLLWVQDDDHPLAIAQEEGVSAQRILDIFRFYGHGPA
jgi:hypothetical protein